MSNSLRKAFAAFAIAVSALPASAQEAPGAHTAQIGFVQVSPEIKVRRLLVQNRRPGGVVLFLHGFPETLYAWESLAETLGSEYEVHAFDWPGYGLSSRPAASEFAYSPRDYAQVLRSYIAAAKIDRSRLVIYATDIGGLPALLAALDEPGIARRIVVGDFAPFDRPQHMHERLQRLKVPATADQARVSLNQTRDDVIAEAFTRGLPKASHYTVSARFQADMRHGWDHGSLTTADAFFHYYSTFTRDQDYLEANLGKLRTPIKVVWGASDPYINQAMGREFAERLQASFEALPGIGHYPHLQQPGQVAEEIRAAFRQENNTLDLQGNK